MLPSAFPMQGPCRVLAQDVEAGFRQFVAHRASPGARHAQLLCAVPFDVALAGSERWSCAVARGWFSHGWRVADLPAVLEDLSPTGASQSRSPVAGRRLAWVRTARQLWFEWTPSRAVAALAVGCPTFSRRSGFLTAKPQGLPFSVIAVGTVPARFVHSACLPTDHPITRLKASAGVPSVRSTVLCRGHVLFCQTTH